MSFMGYSNGGWWGNLDHNMRNIVLDELRNSRPVIFTGTKCITCLGAAHIWVGDGYTESTYDYTSWYIDEYTGSWVCQCLREKTTWISLNWGWGGSSNGEYLAYSISFSGYDKYLRALVNIRP